MSDATRLPRSPELMSRQQTLLVVIDAQTKLLELVPGHERLVWNVGRLLDGAQILNVPVAATEQYPRGLGPTHAELARRLAQIPDKLTFSCGGCEPFVGQLRASGRSQLLLCGIEAHVCVLQTALDLLADGYQVFLAVDAIGARHDVDREIALRRLESAGATLTTTESALFEWCEIAGTSEFKQISQLVRAAGPLP